MESVLIALVPCLIPLVIMSRAVILLAWKKRGRIESIEASLTGLKIQFGKSGRQR